MPSTDFATPQEILIVEDEVLIADTIERYLLQKGYRVNAKAISFEEAVNSYQHSPPQLVILDIRLTGEKTGIDFAHFLRRQSNTPPFIYLTSQIDSLNLELAKQTRPAGFLAKPIQPASLLATVEIALFNHQANNNSSSGSSTNISFSMGNSRFLVATENIRYLEADHIYVKIHQAGIRPIVERSSLAEIMKRLPKGEFIQTHRGYIVNLKYITQWDASTVYLADKAIPISRSRRKEVIALLQSEPPS